MLSFSACLVALLSAAPESAVSALSRECLVAVDARGALVFAVPGGADHVDLPRGIDAILRTPGAAITLRHNHPHSQGLSQADLMMLTASGVSAIEAVARDGSVYRASRGPHFDIKRVARVYHDLDALAAMYFSLEWFQVDDRARLRAQTDHLACLALADAGVISYAGRLSPRQSALLDHYAARVSVMQRWAAAAAVRTER